RNRIASLTPQAAAMSLVRVPLNPCLENRATAFSSSCRRRFSDVRRARGTGGTIGDSAGITGGIFTSEYSLNVSKRAARRQTHTSEYGGRKSRGTGEIGGTRRLVGG